MIKKILITGVSGLLGSNLAFAYREKHTIVGVCYKHKIKINGIKTVSLDLADALALAKLISACKPDVLIHCAALSDVEQCEKDKTLAYRLNVEATKNVVKSLGEAGPYLIYISTDAVYDGLAGNFNENQANPINYYGASKLLGEHAALDYKNTMIVRTNFFGWNVQEKFSLSEWILHSLTERKPIRGFGDVFFSAMYTFLIAEILQDAFQKRLTGVYNLGSSDSISKYDFALRLAEIFKLDKNLIEKISVDDFNFIAKRSKNTSLNVEKIENDLNVNLPTMDVSISALHKDYTNGTRAKMMR